MHLDLSTERSVRNNFDLQIPIASMMSIDFLLGSAWYQALWWTRRQQSRLQDRASIRSKKGTLAHSTQTQLHMATASHCYLQEPMKLPFRSRHLGVSTRNRTCVLPRLFSKLMMPLLCSFPLRGPLLTASQPVPCLVYRTKKQLFY